MSLEENLKQIHSDGIPADEVIKAIHDGLLEVNQTTSENVIRIEELRQLMMLIREDAESTQPNGLELTEALQGHASLKAFVQYCLTQIDELFIKAELMKPVYVTYSRTEVIPVTTIYEYDDTKTPDQSHVVEGSPGVLTITWQEQHINGVSTGQKTDETTTVTTQMVPRKEVIGTLVVNTRAIRYVRVWAKRQGANLGNFNEVEVWVKNSNIARNATVTGSNAITNANYVIDGERNLLNAVVNGSEPYIQLDLKSGRHDLTNMNVLLYNTLTYDFVRVDVSVDGNSWTRIVNRSNYRETGTGIDVSISAIYGSGTTYTDTIPEVEMGGRIRLANPSRTPIYYDSGRAAIKSSSGYYSGSYSTFAVINKAYTTNNSTVTFTRPTGNYVVLYGTNVGWFRADEIGG